MKISVKVIPKSSKLDLVKQADGTFKAHLTKPAIDNQANEQLIKLLAQEFKLAKSKITIIKGQTNKLKIIEITK